MKRSPLQTGAGDIVVSAAGSDNAGVGDDTPVPEESGTDRPGACWQLPYLNPVIASPDRLIATNLCTRPFRARGPRQVLERLGRKNIIHNYGHGGSGWSLSWGSADLSTAMALSTGQSRIAVIGCGALGMTTAIMAQRKGLSTSIYTNTLPPYVHSSFASGVWSPESRICTREHADAFAPRWERQARFSYTMFQNLLGIPGNPVAWRDIYYLSDAAPDTPNPENDREPAYPDLTGSLLNDISPMPRYLARGSHPFPVAHARYAPLMIFNITHYSRMLLDAFHRAGGALEITHFTSPRDFNALDETTIINCTGYGARELMGDDSITPVRGQTAKLIPQPEITYGIRYDSKKVFLYPRSDGLLLQAGSATDFDNDSIRIDPEESRTAAIRLQALMEETMHNQREMSHA